VSEELARLREELAESVSGTRGALVADALRSVPRHLFLPGLPPEQVYSDEALVTKRDADGLPRSSSSQPGLMASMLDELALAPGHRVLEIGAGTGYNAALIRHIVGPSGAVVSIDIDLDTVEEAREHLAAAGYPDVTVLCRDGAEGAPEYAPFDRLIATVGLSDLSPAWMTQLGPAGRMVVPVELHGPMLCAALEREDGYWASRSVQPCGFIKVRGALAGSAQAVLLVEELTVHLPEQRDIDEPALTEALTGGAAVMVPTGVSPGTPQVTWGLHPWLGSRDPRTCEVIGGPDGILPRLPIERRGLSWTFGLVADGSIALLAAAEGNELAVAGYGPDAGSLASALAEAVQAWETAGQPATEGLHMDAYPAGADIPPRPGMVIDRPHTRFALYRA
jgi:protein-L-isoaspartate(D-aspartate) O-methyltransferase